MRWPTASYLLTLCLSLATSGQAVRSNDLSEIVGRHVVFSYPGLNPPTHRFDLIKQGKVGGIILFGENVAENLSVIISNFQDAYKQSSTAKQVGQSSNSGVTAAQSGKDAASALKSYQVNTNLAPVLGVYREAGDFLDNYGRSYGNTSALVGTCGPAFISAQQAAGIIATAKHFPGLGAAGDTENTDEEPVTINLTLDEIRAVGEFPYTKAIPAGVNMVMNSWALYPALDAKYPPGLSKAWIQDELRGRLGFQGVTITDAIEAGALQAFGDDAARGVLASQAGMDIILASARNVTQGEAIVDALVSALQDGALSQESFSEATDRILVLRKKITISKVGLHRLRLDKTVIHRDTLERILSS